jgi:hypothetical protein
MIAFVANTLNTLSTGRGELTMMFESTSSREAGNSNNELGVYVITEN